MAAKTNPILPCFLLCAFALLAGCQKSTPNLVAQIGPVTTTIDPFDNGSGQPIQAVRFKFRNDGPVKVGVVYAKITAYNADGPIVGDSADSYCIFVASGEAQKLKPGQTYETQPGHGFLLSDGIRQGKPALRVQAVPVRAEEGGLPPP